MAVNWQSIEIPFGGGINTKTNPRRLQPPQLEDIQNLVFTDAPGYKSRYGSSVFSSTKGSGGSLSSIKALRAHGDELLVFDDDNVWTYSTVDSDWEDINSGFEFAAPKITQKLHSPGRGNQSFLSIAEVGSLRVGAWTETTGAGTSATFASIEDTSSGWKTVSELSATTAQTKPRVVASSTAIYLIYHDPAATALKYQKVTSAGYASAVTMKSDMNAAGLWDVVVDPTDADSFLIIYRATTNVNGFVFDASTDSVGASQTIESDATRKDITGLAVAANQVSCFIFACDETTPSLWIRSVDLDLSTNLTLETSSGSFTSRLLAISCDETASTAYDGGDVNYWWTVHNANDPWQDISYISMDGTLATTNEIEHCSLATDGFWYNGRGYCVLAHDSEVGSSGSPARNQGKKGLQKTYFLCSGGTSFPPLIQGRIGAGTAFGKSASGQLSNVYSPSSNVFEIPLHYNLRIDNTGEEDGFSNRQSLLARADFSTTDRYQAVQAGGTSYIAAGNVLWAYDGSRLTEAQTLLYPENIEFSADTGGSMTEGDYNYRIYVEYTNAAGERFRSTTAETVTATLNSTNTEVNLTIPTIHHTRRLNTVYATQFVIYRSEADADVASGAPFYRVSSADPTTEGSANGLVMNNLSNGTVSFVDQMADSDLTDNELDYLNSGELDNVAVPDVEYVAAAKNRLWCVGGLDKNKVYYSKLRFAGDMVAFNETLTVQLPDDNDPDGITAIAELNHFVVFFKSDSIYVVSGDGPDNLGRGFFNEPQRVTSDVGCSEPRSVVAYDGGLLFKSDKGIYRLGQNLQVDYIGANVELYNSQDITAATLVNDQNQIRFLTSSGRMLVYDYLVNQWTTFTGWTGISAVNWRNGDIYCWAESDGTVHQEDSSTFEDNGTPVDTSFTTAPITLQGLGGFYRMQRVLFDGDYSTLTNFEVTPYYDGVSTGTEASVLTSALDDNDPFRVIFNMPRQKFSDVKFKITMDKSNSGTSEGVTLQAMRAKVAYKPGLDKLSDGNKFGS